MHTASPLQQPPVFDADYIADEQALAAAFLDATPLSPQREQAINARAADLINAVRATSGGIGGVEELLYEYSLSTREGLALMVLAEALLRVPDAETAERLIEDKLGQGDFLHHERKSHALIVNASAVALGMSARLIRPGETPDSILGQLAKRIGLPALSMATRQAMRVLGHHFVLAETIGEAIARTRDHTAARYRYSFDMLGEGARTEADAERYFASYAEAIDAIGRQAGDKALLDRPSISVKLSALHPRFEAISRERVLREMAPRLGELALKAKQHGITFTVDAEEADRLELSLEVIGAVFADTALEGWDGFGFAVQAYQPRAGAVIAWAADLAAHYGRPMMLRLVKGAYWDTEIKRAQERGLDGYPVFTRKCMTDLNYIACAKQILAARPHLYPQFATHNALTVATLIDCAGGVDGYEFQRLHGMGGELYERLLETTPGVACRIYAPVGGHRDLLAYLVRRLLENGANSSFVSAVSDPDVPVEALLKRPAAILGRPEAARHPRVPLPLALYGEARKNSRGVEFGHRAALEGLFAEANAAQSENISAVSLIDGEPVAGVRSKRFSPIGDALSIGEAHECMPAQAASFASAAAAGFPAWSQTPAETRAAALERAADLLEERRGKLIHLLQVEGGKTLDDALSEVREAADFCRYYAAEGRSLFGEPRVLPGPTGETNRLTLRGRGAFLCISPWNFPLAIFTGQIAAALMAGNSVIAKPAEQTPLIAHAAVRLLHEAGISRTALHLALGDGQLGAALVACDEIAGVAFTGSTEVARHIARALAAKDGPIVPLIAETGGINAMIVDATALPEQVTDDVNMSAFRSAGQRCSALRLLCVQEDVADRVLAMIAGAVRELRIGDPRDPATHIGPVIDAEAKRNLEDYIEARRHMAHTIYAGTSPREGTYVAPHIFEIERPQELTREVFGPVLHVVRYKAAELDELFDAIAGSGYGLTLGLHTRIGETVARVEQRLAVGNVYVNRNMVGAVVGVQPFGGHGLSGTGPKAGGPHYLPRFATEQTVTINTAAAGGNAALLTGVE